MIRLFLAAALMLFAACNSDQQQPSSTAPQATISGEQLFKINCAQCHKPAADFTAPALAGVEKRWESKEQLYNFIHNPQQSIQQNKYAAALFEKWNLAPMQPFPNLSEAEIDSILLYVNEEAAK